MWVTGTHIYHQICRENSTYGIRSYFIFSLVFDTNNDMIINHLMVIILSPKTSSKTIPKVARFGDDTVFPSLTYFPL